MKFKNLEGMRNLASVIILIYVSHLPRFVNCQACLIGTDIHCSEICEPFQEGKPVKLSSAIECFQLDVFSILPPTGPGTMNFKYGTYLGLLIKTPISKPAGCEIGSPDDPFDTSGRPTSYRLGALDEDGFPIGDFLPCNGLSKNCMSEYCDYTLYGNLFDNSPIPGIATTHDCPMNPCFNSRAYDSTSSYIPGFVDIQEQKLDPAYWGFQVVWRPGPINRRLVSKIRIRFILEFATGSGTTERITKIESATVTYIIPDSIDNPTTYPVGYSLGRVACHNLLPPETFDPTVNPSIEGFPTLLPCCGINPMYKSCPPTPPAPPPTPPAPPTTPPDPPPAPPAPPPTPPAPPTTPPDPPPAPPAPPPTPPAPPTTPPDPPPAPPAPPPTPPAPPTTPPAPPPTPPAPPPTPPGPPPPPIVVVTPAPPTRPPPRVTTPAAPAKSTRPGLATMGHWNAAQTKVEEFYEECNGKANSDLPPSKRCIPGIYYPRPPNEQTFREDSCVQGSSCEIILGYGKEVKGDNKEEDEVILELLGQSRFWAAVGFSSDDREMGKDLVIECVSDNNLPVALYASWNYVNDRAERPFDRKQNKRIVDPDFLAKNKKIVRLIESTLESSGNKDYIYCRFGIKKIIRYSFTSPISQVSESYEFQLHQNPVFLIYALGVFKGSKDNFGDGGNLNYHGAKRYFTNNKTTLGLKFFPNEAQQKLMTSHGQIMLLVWMVLLPIGGFIGRYYKETFRKYSICGVKLWLLAHILLSGTAMFLIFVGYFLLSKSKADWQFVGGVRGNPHLYAGITCSSLTFCTMYGGIFMSERSPKDTWHVIELVHGLTGQAAFLSGFLAIYNSGDVLFSDIPCEMYYILWTWILLYFVFHIIMSYHYCWVDWVDGREGRSWWCCNLKVVFQSYDTTALEDAPGIKIRIWILIGFIVFSLVIFSSASWLLSVTPPEASCLSLKEYSVFRN